MARLDSWLYSKHEERSIASRRVHDVEVGRSYYLPDERISRTALPRDLAGEDDRGRK